MFNFFCQTPGSDVESGQGYDSDICYYPGKPGDVSNQTIKSGLMQLKSAPNMKSRIPIQAKRLRRRENHRITFEIATNNSRNYAYFVLQRIIKCVLLFK